MADLTRHWQRRGPLACLLWPISLLYTVVATSHRALYRGGLCRAERAPVPVIVVGNVVAGGAGKTPLVVALLRHFQARGVPVGVISRGHGRRTTDCRAVLPDSDPRDVGDEPLLIARSTGAPVFVARRRIDAARALCAANPQAKLLISDDGLQHHALARDVEICVFDDRGIGNGWRLPAGPLREDWPRHCDLVLHSGARPAFGGFRGQRTLADAAVGATGERVPLAHLAGERVLALAAIAQPQAFFDMLAARGVRPERCVALPDHYDFDSWPRPSGGPWRLVCTEKDAAKLWRVAPDALAVPLTFTPEPAFFEALDARLARLSFADGHQAA